MIRKELKIFLIVGVLTVIVDFLTYKTLLWLNIFSIDASKATGFITGTVFAYFANKIWTFGHKEHAPGSLFRFIILYASTLGANVAINSFILHILNTFPEAMQIAFLFATGTSATLNFIGMKLFAFKENLSKV